MSFTDRSNHTRVVAKVTLFLWLSGFGVGVANACLLEAGRVHHGQPRAMAQVAANGSDDCLIGVGEQACKGLGDLEQSAVVKAKFPQVTNGDPATGAVAIPSMLFHTPGVHHDSLSHSRDHAGR